jgi:hypothetical protein
MTNDRNKSSKRDVAPRYPDPFSALRAEMDTCSTASLAACQLSLEAKKDCADNLFHEVSGADQEGRQWKVCQEEH